MRRLMSWVSVGSMLLLVAVAVTVSLVSAPVRPHYSASRAPQRSPSVGVAATPTAAITPPTTTGSKPTVADPAGLVDPFVGTNAREGASKDVGKVSRADVPFGMVQWGTGTTPDRVQGGGYNYGSSRISGFSLTHLSGAGCSIFGDIPILPTTGAVAQHPGNEMQSFSHADESASPGSYQVRLGSPATTVQLSATTRTGIGQIAFPSTASANVLFKVSDSATALHSSSVRVVGTHEVTGSVTTGYFCGALGTYTLHFVAVFDRPFTRHGVWEYGRLHPGAATCSGASQKS